MRISDWSSDVCSSDLVTAGLDALCDQRLCAGGLCCDRFGDRADLADHINAGAAQTLDQRARRPPEPCDDRYPPIGSASCRERLCQSVLIPVVGVSLNNNTYVITPSS